MESVYITKIEIDKVRNIEKFSIPLSSDVKNNLIITGRNGSGKTSLINELKRFLQNIPSNSYSIRGQQYDNLDNYYKAKEKFAVSDLSPKQENELNRLNRQIDNTVHWFSAFGGTDIDIKNGNLVTEMYKKGEFILAFFEAKRNTHLSTPTGVNKISFKPIYGIDEHAGTEFIQYIVNLKADRSFAKDDDDFETIKKIDSWFEKFEKSLKELFDNDRIRLQFDRKEYNFNVLEDSKQPYNLNQLSDGFSAILSIVTELIIRMEERKSKNYDVQGIVLVDEIETHLHVELQKKVLPFLTSFFPGIQFIVTTHSPFVISSISNAVICDLEKKIVTSDLTGYSYDTIIESYFNSDKYSVELGKRINEFEELKNMTDLNDQQRDRLTDLKMYLNEIPKFISDELAVKLQQIKLKDIKKREK